MITGKGSLPRFGAEGSECDSFLLCTAITYLEVRRTLQESLMATEREEQIERLMRRYRGQLEQSLPEGLELPESL